MYSTKILYISQVICRIVTYVVRHQRRAIIRRKTILHFIENIEMIINQDLYYMVDVYPQGENSNYYPLRNVIFILFY